jgi:hypothetical protein
VLCNGAARLRERPVLESEDGANGASAPGNALEKRIASHCKHRRD